ISMFNQVYQQALANHVTVFASSGDSGTANIERAAGVSAGPLLPFPTVQWPSADPLVTSAGEPGSSPTGSGTRQLPLTRSTAVSLQAPPSTPAPPLTSTLTRAQGVRKPCGRKTGPGSPPVAAGAQSSRLPASSLDCHPASCK